MVLLHSWDIRNSVTFRDIESKPLDLMNMYRIIVKKEKWKVEHIHTLSYPQQSLNGLI